MRAIGSSPLERSKIFGFYGVIGLPHFRQELENISFDVGKYDARRDTPGRRRVRPDVSRVERRTILPPDLWQRYEGASIWRHPVFNTQRVALAELNRD